VNDDDRLSRYLSDQAEGITLGAGDPNEVMRRGTRRRTRRRGALVGGVAVIGLLATSVVLRDGGDDQKVDVTLATPDVSASTYDWSTLSPDAGLGYAGSQAQLADGSLYGLSTAPGPVNEQTYNRPATLYRSDDGAEWTKVTLPTGLSPSSIASSGDTLYALGTAPAGGSTRDLVLAASHDGAATWSSITLPHEVGDLEARHPGQIVISSPRIAAVDATHQLATVVVSANLDPTNLKPEYKDQDVTWQWTDTGVTFYEAKAPCLADPNGEITAKDAKACRGAAPSTIVDDGGNGAEIASYTWDELGVDQELRDLTQGRTFDYVTDDGATFERVTLPVAGKGWGSEILAGPNGYSQLLGSWTGKDSSTTVLQSPDGHTWTETGTLNGAPMSSGFLGDRPAVSLSLFDGRTAVQVQQPDGTWSEVNLTGAVPAPADGAQPWISSVSFGPLGLAAVAGSYTEKGTGDNYIVHSTDGVHLSLLKISDVVKPAGSPLGVTVTADAITVRLSHRVDDDPATPPQQTVLVGTPRS
jgi:hypothetical protein